jgi:hypothetical protein
MSKMIPVRIETDECRTFWPNIFEVDQRHSFLSDMVRGSPTMEVPEEFIEEYEAALATYSRLVQQLEHLFRIQQGLEPLHFAVPPKHRLITLNLKS